MADELKFTRGSFRSFDGLRLYFEHHHASGPPRAALLLVHGYSDHVGASLRELAQRLTPLGYEVLAFDFRGHGRSEGRRGYIQRFSDYIADLEHGLSHLQSAAPHLPLGIIAQSHGGLITLSMLVEERPLPQELRGVVLSCPFLGLALAVPWYKTVLARLVSGVLPWLSLPNDLRATKITHDPDKVYEFAADPLVHRVATARWYTEMLKAQRFVAEHADRVHIPTLWQLAGDDRIVSTPASRAVFQRARGDKQLIEYDGFYHELLHEPGGDRVFRDLTTWLESHVATANSSPNVPETWRVGATG